MWTGSSEDGGQAQIQCEDDLTPDSEIVLRNPATTLAVNSELLHIRGFGQTPRRARARERARVSVADNSSTLAGALWDGSKCHTEKVSPSPTITSC